MRGSPFIQWLAFVAVWLLLLIPISVVTRPPALEAKTGAEQEPGAERLRAWLTLRFSVEPTTLVIRQGGRVLWQEDQPVGRFFEGDVLLEVDDLGFDVLVEAGWPSGESAIEIMVEPDDREVFRRTLWRQDGLTETLAFMWGRHD